MSMKKVKYEKWLLARSCARRKELVTSLSNPFHSAGKLFACFPRTPVRYDVLAGIVCGRSLELQALPT